MKIAILYTGYRQLDELDLAPEFFRRSPRLRELDVVYHCNNADVSTAVLQQKLDKIPCKSMTLLHHPVNKGGYAYGQFEAICDAWDTLVAGGWDWVIHFHPDIFVVDEKPLFQAIDDATAAGAPLMVTRIFGTHPSYATDFFALRPRLLSRSLYECYECLVDEPIIVPLEDLYFMEVHRQKIKPFVADRFVGNTWYRDIDRLGLWHEHNLDRIRLWFQKPGSRWKVTARRALNLKKSAAMAARWGRSRMAGMDQVPLSKLLTRV